MAIPHVLAGRDVLGCAQTGTGKTAAFAVPILQRLAVAPRAHQPHIRALILSPTRELAIQISESFGAYGRNTGLRHAVVFGGVGQAPQEKTLRRGVDILVATPGRLLDLMNQGLVPLGRLEIFVLDEADRMLDMGFIHDVRRVIAAIPKRRQTLLFSATAMPAAIQDLAASVLHDPVKVEGRARFEHGRPNRSVHLLRREERQTLASGARVAQPCHSARAGVHSDKSTEPIAWPTVSFAEAWGPRRSTAINRKTHDNEPSHDASRAATCECSSRPTLQRAASTSMMLPMSSISISRMSPESYVHRIGRTARAGRIGDPRSPRSAMAKSRRICATSSGSFDNGFPSWMPIRSSARAASAPRPSDAACSAWSATAASDSAPRRIPHARPTPTATHGRSTTSRAATPVAPLSWRRAARTQRPFPDVFRAFDAYLQLKHLFEQIGLA